MATIPPNLTVRVKGQGIQEIQRTIAHLARREVLVGFPAETTARDPTDEDETPGITNAAIAYINENGDPDLNIPARPFLSPAMENMREAIQKGLVGAARVAVTSGSVDQVDGRLHAIGQRCADAARAVITAGISPALADATLRARARKGKKGMKGALKELASRAEGNAPSTEHAKPLFETGALYRALTHVLRNRNERGN